MSHLQSGIERQHRSRIPVLRSYARHLSGERARVSYSDLHGASDRF